MCVWLHLMVPRMMEPPPPSMTALTLKAVFTAAPADCKIIVLARGDNAAAATGRVTANLQAKNLLSSPISEALSSGGGMLTCYYCNC